MIIIQKIYRKISKLSNKDSYSHFTLMVCFLSCDTVKLASSVASLSGDVLHSCLYHYPTLPFDNMDKMEVLHLPLPQLFSATSGKSVQTISHLIANWRAKSMLSVIRIKIICMSRAWQNYTLNTKAERFQLLSSSSTIKQCIAGLSLLHVWVWNCKALMNVQCGITANTVFKALRDCFIINANVWNNYGCVGLSQFLYIDKWESCKYLINFA